MVHRLQPLPYSPMIASLLGFSLLLGGCAGTPFGESMQQSLESDPQLEENPAFEQSSPTESETADSDAVTPGPESTPKTASRADRPPADRVATGTPSSSAESAKPAQSADESISPSVLEQVPEELRPYVVDLRALGLLQKDVSGESQLQPNQPVSRAQYAQWLFRVNNRFYSDQPDKRIRAGVSSSEPVFEDVSSSHFAFAAIQGLAEAGIIPSPLSGSSTSVNFRPEAPLTRKDLVLWKIPLDTREALPAATATAISEAWGFQDASKIEPLAQRAVLADHQNGEFANIRRAFGYTTLFQPDKAVTEAEAAAALWRFGSQTEGISAEMLRQRPGQSSAARETRSE